MKTINKHIQIFNTLEAAKKAFEKVERGDLLFNGEMYFVDESPDGEGAYDQWPLKYTVIAVK